MYIKKNDRELIEKMNKQFKIPKDFDKYIDKISRINASLIIKKGNTHTCTYCNNSFKSKNVAGYKELCPKCHHNFMVKGFGIMLYREEYDIGLLDKIENQFVIRLFRVQANYYRGDYKSYYREYARGLLDGRLFVNSCYVRGMYFEKVYMFSYADKWRYGPNYFNLNAIFYPNNIKKLLKETPCKYSMIWDLARHQKDTYIDLKKLLNEAPNNPSIELLIKAKLFNLALNADRYNIKGSFEDRFGVPREYYSFMKKYNITSDELDVLKLLKKKNINTIRTLTSNYNINKLQQFANLTSLDNLLKYKNKLGKAFDFDMYLDYLENANLLRFNLKDKKYLFPKDLRQEHDCLVKKVKRCNSKVFDRAVEERFVELNKNTYKNNLYMIRPAQNRNDFLSEAEQQGNCVFTNYFTKHAKGSSDIYFMRRLEKENKSFITVEVIGNKVVQKRTKGNNNPGEKECEFLKEWENRVLGKVA